ncbi:hypothetical protein WA016_06015 [Myxococcus stipitatus]
MRLRLQPNRPRAMTCFCFSSLKTLPIPGADSTSYPGVNVSVLSIGRFSGDLHWPVLGDH